MADIAKRMSKCVELGKAYLLSKITDGLCFGFHGFKHGPSWAWVTACVGSTLSEFGFVSQEMLEIILSLQCKNGGWGYNPKVFSDADTTLRVIQFLKKIGFRDKAILERAERFVISHQLADGGFTTYLPEAAESTGYQDYEKGWCSSHPCVTALAINQLSDPVVVARAKNYLLQRLNNGDAKAYWWQTHYYVRYEMGYPNGESQTEDPVELALALLLKSKRDIYNSVLIGKLLFLQYDNGSFPPSQQLRCPLPNRGVDDVREDERIVEDSGGIFSTCATIVAIKRQQRFT